MQATWKSEVCSCMSPSQAPRPQRSYRSLAPVHLLPHSHQALLQRASNRGSWCSKAHHSSEVPCLLSFGGGLGVGLSVLWKHGCTLAECSVLCLAPSGPPKVSIVFGTDKRCRPSDMRLESWALEAIFTANSTVLVLLVNAFDRFKATTGRKPCPLRAPDKYHLPIRFSHSHTKRERAQSWKLKYSRVAPLDRGVMFF